MDLVIFPGIVLSSPTAALRYGDLDQLGQPVVQIVPGSVLAADFAAGAITTKLSQVGGAGIGGQYVLLKDYKLPLSARTVSRFATVPVSGVKVGDAVKTGVLLQKITNAPDSAFNGIITGNVETDNVVNLWATGLLNGSQVLKAGSRINFRVFTF